MAVDVFAKRLFVYLQPMEPRWRAGFKVATTQAMFDFIRGTFDHRNRLYLYFSDLLLILFFSRWRWVEEGNPWDGFYLL